jgi:hypothetical protein
MLHDPTGLKLLESIAPVRDIARKLVQEAQAIKDAVGRQPAADSSAMTEFAAEASYAGAWSPEPLHLARSLGGLWDAAVSSELLEVHAAGRAEVAGKVEAARGALDDLLAACKTHDARTLAAVQQLCELTALDAEAATDTVFMSGDEEFVANVAGQKIYLTADAHMLAQLAAEALTSAGLRDQSLAQQALEQVASAWPRGALTPWSVR